jgi:hypothetical protein
MDLIGETVRLRLDMLAVQISRQLQLADVPHALLKGPSTATWLYDPPRGYRDVDMLVPLSRVDDAVEALRAAGIATAGAGGVGEEAQHSLLMLSTAGFEVDVHISLPTVAPHGDRVWNVLAPHVEPLDLGIGTVPALDEPARCLVLALHAVSSGAVASQPMEDLRRASQVADGRVWRAAGELARRLDVADLLAAGLHMVNPTQGGPAISPRAYLYASGAPSEALGLQRLADARKRDLPRMLWREFVPTRGFMRRAYPESATGFLGLLRAHVRRWRRIAAQLPAVVASWRAARR